MEFEVTEVELKVEELLEEELVELLDGVEEGGGREYLREQEYTRFLQLSRIYVLENVLLWLFRVRRAHT